MTSLRPHLAWLARPGVWFVMLCVVVIDVFTLAPGDSFNQSGSVVANRIGSFRLPKYRERLIDGPRPAIRVGWFAANDEVRALGPNDEPDTFRNYYLSMTSFLHGFWGLTRERFSFTLMYDSGGRRVPPPSFDARADSVVEAYFASLPNPRWNAEYQRVKLGGPSATTVNRWVPAGVARNALSVSLWALFLATIGLRCLEVRRQERLKSGRCAWCNYDVSAVPSSAVCPECGRTPPPVSAPPCKLWRMMSRVPRAPYAPAALLGLLVVDAVLLPHGDEGAGSWIGNHLPTPALRRDHGDGRRREALSMSAYLDHGALRFVDEAPTGVTVQVMFRLVHESSTYGWWAPTRMLMWSNVGGTGWEQLPRHLLESFKPDLAAALRAEGRTSWALDVERSEVHAGWSLSRRWTGYAHNAGTMLVAYAMVTSVVGRLVGRRRRRAK